MTEREFCYWLQGLFEVGKPESLSAEQTEMIRKHLALVFTKVTTGIPSRAVPHRAPNPADTFDALKRAAIKQPFEPSIARCATDRADVAGPRFCGGLGLVKDADSNVIARR